MKGYDSVLAIILSPRQAHVTDDADKSATWHEDAKALLPHAIQFLQEHFVIAYVPKLTIVVSVFF
jgi:hypothetical protein